MFPITHIWFSRGILGHINNLTVLGSIFPDTAISGCLNHEQTHSGGWGLYKFFEDKYMEYLDFVKASVIHTVNPRGLDFYSDEEYGQGYKGYCFQKAQEIEEEVIDACNIPVEFGLWKAHNFIEMGIEVNIATLEKGLVDVLHEGLNDSFLIGKLSSPLESYFGISNLSIYDCFKRFAGFVEVEDLNSYNLAKKYDIQMKTKHGIGIDVPKCCDIIEKSRIIVKDDFDDFIEYCSKKVNDTLREGDV
ncbi:MAG: hypothetical protein ACM3TR_18320 [Caulobacteraceae bacterium]